MTDRGKAKPIDKVLAEEHNKDGGGGGHHNDDDNVIVWPAPCSTVQVDVQQQQQQQQQEEEDLLGYGTAEPTTSRQQRQHSHRHTARPRRSSLSNKNDTQRLSHRRASIGYSGEMTLTLPTKNTVTKRRSITFSSDDDVTIESGVSVDEKEEDDVNEQQQQGHQQPAVDTRQLWFHQEEYRHIEEKVRDIIRNSKRNNDRPTWQEEDNNNNKLTPTTTTTLRGLEGVIDTSLAEERSNVIRSVLEDQASQREMGVFDEEMIASTYQYNSMDAQLIAVDRAKQDEQDIQGYLETTRKIHQQFNLQQRRMSC